MLRGKEKPSDFVLRVRLCESGVQGGSVNLRCHFFLPRLNKDLGDFTMR